VEYNFVKVFSATKARDRDELGERITEFLTGRVENGWKVSKTVVTQSSDCEFHCLSIVLFMIDPARMLRN
jgi:hypothetical protein